MERFKTLLKYVTSEANLNLKERRKAREVFSHGNLDFKNLAEEKSQATLMFSFSKSQVITGLGRCRVSSEGNRVQ